MWRLRFALLCCWWLAVNAAGPPNVLLIVVDNMRPAMGAYGVESVITPCMDALAAGATGCSPAEAAPFRQQTTLFSRSFCQLAWCSPSRNSFLTGRRPDVTKAWNFLDSFREPGIGQNWTTMPGYFKQHGYYTTSIGKVFHPRLPPNFDFPYSWSDQPVMPIKPQCPNNTMTCVLEDSMVDADATATKLAVERLQKWASNHPRSSNSSAPFFMAVGYQSPRLPWSYPASAAARYPPAGSIPIARHLSSSTDPLEWFRPVEVDVYSDIHNITHGKPLDIAKQHSVRRAYYAAITHVDDQVGRLMAALESLGSVVTNNTIVFFMADHGQNLGEANMWSMMNLLETSARVPMVVRAPNLPRMLPVYSGMTELVDVFPTLVGLAGLPAPQFELPGVDLSDAIQSGKPAKEYALTQITRCLNCSVAYPFAPECKWDSVADKGYSVACGLTPRTQFNVMGMSIRSSDWRFTQWCAWDGQRLQADWTNCKDPELYDHRNDTSLYNVDAYEYDNLANNSSYASIVKTLQAALRKSFAS